MADPIKPAFTFSDEPPKRGPGRPKGSTTTPPKSASTPSPATQAEIKQALASLETAYNLIGTGLLLGGFTSTLANWQESQAKLEASNPEALAASPKLAKWLANAGSTGGATAFILMHGIAFAGLAKGVTSELELRRMATPSEDENTFRA